MTTIAPSSFPGQHPLPPGDLDHQTLPIVETTRVWFRNHRRIHDPIHFSASVRHGRFNDPDGTYGVLYLGSDAECAFIEVFGQTDGRSSLALGKNAIAESMIAARCICPVRACRALRLVDLTANGLARLYADNRLCTGDWSISQQWSRALWLHPASPDGILYRSRHAPSTLAVALFERVQGVLAVECVGSAEPCCSRNMLRDLHSLARLLDRYGYALIDDVR